MTHANGMTPYYEKMLAPLIGGKVVQLITDGEYIGIKINKTDTAEFYNVWFYGDEEGNYGGVPVVEKYFDTKKLLS